MSRSASIEMKWRYWQINGNSYSGQFKISRAKAFDGVRKKVRGDTYTAHKLENLGVSEVSGLKSALWMISLECCTGDPVLLWLIIGLLIPEILQESHAVRKDGCGRLRLLQRLHYTQLRQLGDQAISKFWWVSALCQQFSADDIVKISCHHNQLFWRKISIPREECQKQ